MTKHLARRRLWQFTCLLIEGLPVILTAIIWLIIYAKLDQVAHEHTQVVMDFGAGALLVSWHRRKIANGLKRTKELFVKK